MRDAEASFFGITVGGTAISNLRYADDTALIENSKEALEYSPRVSMKLESN